MVLTPLQIDRLFIEPYTWRRSTLIHYQYLCRKVIVTLRCSASFLVPFFLFFFLHEKIHFPQIQFIYRFIFFPTFTGQLQGTVKKHRSIIKVPVKITTGVRTSIVLQIVVAVTVSRAVVTTWEPFPLSQQHSSTLRLISVHQRICHGYPRQMRRDL